MNELSDELKPYRSLIDSLTKELGYDPSEGCTFLHEVLDRLHQNHQLSNFEDKKEESDMANKQSIELKIINNINPDQIDKTINFDIEPNASIVVNDKISEKRRTYIPPVPQISSDELKILAKDIVDKRQKLRDEQNKPKTNIISNLINKFIK